MEIVIAQRKKAADRKAAYNAKPSVKARGKAYKAAYSATGITVDMFARFSNTISVAFIEFKSGYGRLFYVPTQRANACVYEHDETFKMSYANSQVDSQVSSQLKSNLRSNQLFLLRSMFLDFTVLRTLGNNIC